MYNDVDTLPARKIDGVGQFHFGVERKKVEVSARSGIIDDFGYGAAVRVFFKFTIRPEIVNRDR